MTEPPIYAGVDYDLGAEETPETYPTIQAKLRQGLEVLATALDAYRHPAIMWTGGKDSTLALYLVKELCDDLGMTPPPAIFIDHYQHFDVVHEFVERWSDRWAVELIYARNEDIGRYVETHGLEPGDDIQVDALGDVNRHHIEHLLEYEEDTFRFLLDTYVGNHLLKTVALNETLESHGFDAIISGVRWDEQEARAEETFFSPRHDPEIYPPHDRVHPILQFTERDVWDATWDFMVPDVVEGYPEGHRRPTSADDLPEGITPDALPISPKYFDGFRSLGSEVSTKRTSDEPAWLQDLEGSTERAGRAQDKENLMKRLRELGYM